MLQVRCAHPTGVFAPKRPFGTFRCCAWLILRFRTDPPSVRRCSARLIRQAETLELQPLRGLHQTTPCSLIQNAHASGSLRSPYGYREPKATPQAAAAASSPLRTETAFQAVPVFRMAYSLQTAHCAVCRETLMLQVRYAHPAGTGEPNCASLCLPCVRGGVGRTKDV